MDSLHLIPRQTASEQLSISFALLSSHDEQLVSDNSLSYIMQSHPASDPMTNSMQVTLLFVLLRSLMASPPMTNSL